MLCARKYNKTTAAVPPPVAITYTAGGADCRTCGVKSDIAPYTTKYPAAKATTVGTIWLTTNRMVMFLVSGYCIYIILSIYTFVK
jgi:hypothetical protein